MSDDPQAPEKSKGVEIRDKWIEILKEPSRFKPMVLGFLGGLFLVAAVLAKHGLAASVGAMAVLLLACNRLYRELLVAAILLGASVWGFSEILQKVWEPGSIAPGKATIMIVVILSWTTLVALCLGRLRGGRDDE